ncbi:MAG: EAL domain-containing protein [Pseudomonadota bacterium]
MIDIKDLLFDVIGRIDDAVYVKDPSGAYLYVNRRAARLFGKRADEILGAHDTDLFPRQDAKQLAALDKRVTNTGKTVCAETRYRTLTGERRFTTRLSPALDAEGNLQGIVGVARDVTDQRDSHDSLTGLLNLHGLTRKIERLLRQGSSRLDPVDHVLCVVDLHNVEIANELCGHQAGDELLSRVARLLERHASRGDVCARLNSDEFALLLPQRDAISAEEIANNLVEEISAYRARCSEKSVSLASSIGLAVISPDISSAARAISMAKHAASSAKKRSRNRFAWYDESDHTVRTRRSELEALSQFNQAMEHDRFELFAQKICPLGVEGGLPSYEVLVRLRTSTGELMRPTSFLPVVEKSLRAAELDRWVIEHAFAWIAEHRDALERVDHFALNISGQSLGDESLVRSIHRAFETHGVPHSKVCFEITETAAIEELTHAVHFINLLRDSGCRVALDDFGAGLSSFRYLRDMPVDYVKIDGSFVRNICTNRSDYIVARGMHALTRDMGIRSVAEFIENAQIEHALREIGVDFGQGLFIHSPEPLSSIRALH